MFTKRGTCDFSRDPWMPAETEGRPQAAGRGLTAAADRWGGVVDCLPPCISAVRLGRFEIVGVHSASVAVFHGESTREAGIGDISDVGDNETDASDERYSQLACRGDFAAGQAGMVTEKKGDSAALTAMRKGFAVPELDAVRFGKRGRVGLKPPTART